MSLHVTLLELSALFVTYLAFGAAGYPLARRFKSQVAIGTWATLVISIDVLGLRSLGETWLIAVGGFRIYLIKAVQALIFGMLIGLIVREIQNKHAARGVV